MLVILRIGYQRFILPNEKGVATILRALSKAQEIKDDKRYEGGGIELSHKAADVQVEMLPPSWCFTKRKKEEAYLDPEILPPIRGDLGTGSGLSLPPPAPRRLGQGRPALPRPRQLLIGDLS